MKKPYIICHMMTSLDGKILTANWGSSSHTKPFTKVYEEVHDTFNADAWICGRVTMEKDFSKGTKPHIIEPATSIDRTDFIADKKVNSFAIAVDASGKLGWPHNEISGDHIIEVLTESVSDGYLAYLRKKEISYIFGGATELDFALVAHKLATLFPIKTLMLEGGGHLNGSFLNAGLIDELSLLHLPVADGTPASPTLFEVSANLPKHHAVYFDLHNIKKMDDGILWLTYKKKKA